MATVATSTSAPNHIAGSALRISARDVTFSSSYSTGGEALTAAQFGLGSIFFAVCTVKTPAGSVTEVVYDNANGKIKALLASAEVTAATNLSALVVEVVAFGKE